MAAFFTARPPYLLLALPSLALAASVLLATAFVLPGGNININGRLSSWTSSAAMTTTNGVAALAPTATANSTLGPVVMRKLVIDASASSRERSLDLGGIVWLEHLNLVVGDMDTAMKFYVDLLGFSRDDNPKHINLGQQQFHLAATGEPAQRITGSIGLTVPNLQRIRDRLGDAQLQLKDTKFSVKDFDDDGMTMTITCPWGNIIHLYDLSIDGSVKATSDSTQKMVKMHSAGGAYGAHRMAVRGGPGIRYVEIACRTGTAAVVAEFYEKMLGCQVARTTVCDDGMEVEAAIVCVGPGVHMAYVESQQLSDDTIERMSGVHACIYIPNFEGTYNMLKGRNLIWTNPRFTHLDSCDTWEEARASLTLRFKDIVNMQTGEKVLEFEHETRPMIHGQYMKVPPYVPN